MSRRTLVYGAAALALIVAVVIAVAVVLYGGADKAQAAGAPTAAESVRDPGRCLTGENGDGVCDYRADRGVASCLMAGDAGRGQTGCPMAGAPAAVGDCCGR